MNLVALQRYAVAACLLGLLAGCASTLHQAPVENHRNASTAELAPSTAPSRPPPGIENAGKPGYYTVKPGDTLYHISVDSKQSWQDLVAWNKLDNPNMIEVGQVLRVVPPVGEHGAAPRAVASSSQIESKPLERSSDTKAEAAVPAASAASSPSDADDASALKWVWPTAGAVLEGFDESKHKGLSLSGKLHDPVLAAAAGRVVYAGSALPGYGKMIIIKHNANYISVYAHNDVLLVSMDEAVRRGQKIAEMGSSDSARVELYFEVRKLSKPIDPARVLPAR